MSLASVVVNQPIQLGYGNGTYVILPPGTYNNITRINGQWYVNGEVCPQSTASPMPTAFPTPTNSPSPTNNPIKNPVSPTSKPAEPTATQNENTIRPSQTLVPIGTPEFPILYIFIVVVEISVAIAVILFAKIKSNSAKNIL